MNEKAPPRRLSIGACYATAWRSFAKWWIPLCLVSGVLMVFQVGPKQLAREEAKATRRMIADVGSALIARDAEQVERLVIKLNDTVQTYTRKLLTIAVYVAPVVAVLGVLLICISLMAVANRRRKHGPGKVALVSLAHLAFSLARVLLLFACFPLGVYIYIKLYFVILIMLEKDKGLVAAVKASWRATDGRFWPLLAIVTINSTIQFAVVPTVIGLIPATAFANTVRAAAYRMVVVSKAPPPVPR